MSFFINDRADPIVRNELRKDLYGFAKIPKDECLYYIDLGANHGLVLLKLLADGFHFRKALMVEPFVPTFEILKQNLADIPEAILLHACFGKDEEPQYLSYFCSNNSGATRFDSVRLPQQQTEAARSVTLQGLMARYQFVPEKLLLKCDCEGAERFLLAPANLPIVMRCPFIVGEIHSISREAHRDLFKQMSETHTLSGSGTTFRLLRKGLEV